jgi:hypothetical protein
VYALFLLRNNLSIGEWTPVYDRGENRLKFLGVKMEISVRKSAYANWSEVKVMDGNTTLTADISDGFERKDFADSLFNAIYKMYKNDDVVIPMSNLIMDNLCDFEIEQIVKKIMSERRDLDFTLDEDE